MYFFLSIYLLGIIGFLIHLFMLPKKARVKARVIELLLLYQIVFSLGITSLVAFIGLSFMANYVASYLAWPSCPFEQELANVNLAFGILGIMSIWYRGLFWVATVLGFSIWILADGFHHIVEYFVAHNASAGNVGMPLYTDFIIPIVLLVLLALHLRTPAVIPAKKKRAKDAKK